MGERGKEAAGEKQEKRTMFQRDEGPAPEDAPKCCSCRFPLLVALLQLLLGVAVTAVAFLMLAVSGSLTARETPHWAGITLCLISILGFMLYCITYLPEEKTSMQFIAKLLYFVLCTIGLVISVLVTAFAGHHYTLASRATFHCTPAGHDCVCTLVRDDPIARTFTYQGVGGDCEAITGTLTMYFLVQMVLNLTQAVVCAVGGFIMWKHRYQVFFAGLQMGSSPQWQKA